jgi:hypothetical protein
LISYSFCWIKELCMMFPLIYALHIGHICISNNFHKENTCGMSTLYFISSNVMDRGTNGRTIPFLPGLEFTVALLEVDSSLLQSAVSVEHMQGLILNYTLTIRLGGHTIALCHLALSYIFPRYQYIFL